MAAIEIRHEDNVVYPNFADQGAVGHRADASTTCEVVDFMGAAAKIICEQYAAQYPELQTAWERFQHQLDGLTTLRRESDQEYCFLPQPIIDVQNSLGSNEGVITCAITGVVGPAYEGFLRKKLPTTGVACTATPPSIRQLVNDYTQRYDISFLLGDGSLLHRRIVNHPRPTLSLAEVMARIDNDGLDQTRHILVGGWSDAEVLRSVADMIGKTDISTEPIETTPLGVGHWQSRLAERGLVGVVSGLAVGGAFQAN